MGSILIKTEIPGPKSLEWMARRQAAVPRGPYHATPIFMERAEGAVLEDVDGNRYLDFAGGIGVMNVGHAAPAVVAAVKAQAERFLHACFSVTPYSGYVRLAEKLNQLTPGDFAKKTLFVNSGAEGVENAVKIARAATGRPAILCFEDAFHGRTLLTLTLTSKIHPYKDSFGPFAPEVYRVPYAYCYRCSYSLAYPECHLFCARHLEDTFQRVVQADRVAAVVVEPILGEGGFVVPPAGYFGVLEEICRKHNILIVADEVQTGFGRTGTLFASAQFGFVPDLLVSAKSMAGGLPLAAITGRAEIMDRPVVGGLGGTFGGNPAACAAALAVMEIFEKENLLERSQQIGRRFQEQARRWARDYALIGDCRGLGAMQALELVADRASRQPAKEETSGVAEYCYKHGLITITAGTYGNVIRTLMPLVITDEQLEEGMEILEAAISQVSSAKSARQAARE